MPEQIVPYLTPSAIALYLLYRDLISPRIRGRGNSEKAGPDCEKNGKKIDIAVLQADVKKIQDDRAAESRASHEFRQEARGFFRTMETKLAELTIEIKHLAPRVDKLETIGTELGTEFRECRARHETERES